MWEKRAEVLIPGWAIVLRERPEAGEELCGRDVHSGREMRNPIAALITAKLVISDELPPPQDQRSLCPLMIRNSGRYVWGSIWWRKERTIVQDGSTSKSSGVLVEMVGRPGPDGIVASWLSWLSWVLGGSGLPYRTSQDP